MAYHYLELSKPSTGEHKFYEISSDNELSYTVRYGRIGAQGQTKANQFDTAEAMQKSLEKTLAEKYKKGYQPASIGQTAAKETRHQAMMRQIKSLFSIIANGNNAISQYCFNEFKIFIEDEDNKEEYAEEECPNLIEAALIDAAEWQLMYFVDWKDRESILATLDKLCRNLNIAIQFDWHCNNPSADLTVQQIILSAHQQLQSQGYGLWAWDIGSDSYQGWIARHADYAAISELTLALELSADYPTV